MLNPDELYGHSASDPIRSSIEDSGAVYAAWVGKKKQPRVQRVGFSLVSIFAIGLGSRLAYIVVQGWSLGALFPLGLAIVLLGVGSAGLWKAITGKSRFRRS